MREVVLDDYRIEGLALRPEVTSAFPFLLVRAPEGQRCCGGRHHNHVDYDHVKRSLLNLDEGGRRRLKELMGASSVLFYPPAGPDGVVKAVRF